MAWNYRQGVRRWNGRTEYLDFRKLIHIKYNKVNAGTVEFEGLSGKKRLYNMLGINLRRLTNDN